MSDFIVSARKYRPATFSSVVGQKHITSTLKNAIERGQLAHAYLFCGPRGVGKTTCARIFAKAINCLAPDGAEACNACESCRSFNEGRSLNIHELDAASNNSVEDIRTLIEQVRIIPQVGRYSVFIIDEVHMLSASAFNAFLKTLEEPPAHAIFILATTEKHKIIPTILSRCQIYDFNRIRVEDSVEYLKYIASEEQVTADEESLNLIAQKADGGMRDALSMFDKAVSFCGSALDYRHVAQTLNVLDYDTYFGITDMLLAGDYVGALVAFDGVLSKGFSGQTFIAGLNRHMRDLLMAKQPETLRLIEMTGTLLERYRRQAEACKVDFLFGAVAFLTELDGKIRQSSSQRLLVELGLMKIAGLGQKKNEPLTSSGEYPLPELTPRSAESTPAAASAAQTAQAAPKPEKAPAQPVGNVSAPARPEAVEPAEQIPDPAEAEAVKSAEKIPAASKPEAVKPAEHAPAPAAKAPPETTADAPAAAATPSAADRDIPHDAVSTTVAASETSPAPETATPPAVDADSAASGQPLAAGGQPSAANGQPPAAPVGTARAARKPLISGTSLSELLAPAVEADDNATENIPAEAVEDVPTDPECTAKLERARDRILELIRAKRPRFVAVFEPMTIRDGCISISVPTAQLRDEILRSKTDMLMRFAELAGIKGRIGLEVTVNEQIRASRPIKVEDRVKYLTEKNPLLAELRKSLDLEIE